MDRHLVAAFLGILSALAVAAAPFGADATPGAKATAPAPAAKPGAAPSAKPESGPASQAKVAETTFAYVKAPLFSDDFASLPVARVEGEIITMRQLTAALAGLHGSHGPEDRDHGPGGAGKTDFGPVLDRLVNARLLVLEAREMGIGELPEFEKSVEEYRDSAGQELLKERVVKDVKADPAQVQRIYEDSVREWKVRSVLLYQEATAKAFQNELKAGKRFEELARKLVAEKKGEFNEKAEFPPRSKMLPQVIAALEQVKVGQVTAPAKVEGGWAMLEVQDVRYPDDANARAQAEKVVLSQARNKALQTYYVGLVKKYAKLNKKLLDSLDFEAKRPGLMALQKDRRVLASFSGDARSLTVGDLADALAQGFFHGADRAVKEKKINRQKYDVFDGLMSRRLVALEVKAQGIDRSPELDRKVADFESNLLFTRFLEKVIVPEIKLDEAAVRTYWEAHKGDYTYPAFWRLESLAFGNVKSAQSAIDKLRSGTDFKWLNANAEGQVKPSERKVILAGVLAASTLPKDVAGALAGAKKGDYRLYASPEGHHYAVHVVDYTPPAEQPFEEVREAVTQRLYLDKLGKSIESWAAKLRNARKVEVFITKIGS